MLIALEIRDMILRLLLLRPIGIVPFVPKYYGIDGPRPNLRYEENQRRGLRYAFDDRYAFDGPMDLP